MMLMMSGQQGLFASWDIYRRLLLGMLNVQGTGMTAGFCELPVRTVFGWGTEDASKQPSVSRFLLRYLNRGTAVSHLHVACFQRTRRFPGNTGKSRKSESITWYPVIAIRNTSWSVQQHAFTVVDLIGAAH
jgi:hypothetical protein